MVKFTEEYVADVLRKLGAYDQLKFPDFPSEPDVDLPLPAASPIPSDRQQELMEEYAGQYRFGNASGSQVVQLHADGSCQVAVVFVGFDPASMALSVGEMPCLWRIVSEVPGLGVRFVLYQIALTRDPNNVYGTGRCPATGCFTDSFVRVITTTDGTQLSNEADIFTDYEGNVLSITATDQTYDIVSNPPGFRYTEAQAIEALQALGADSELTFPEFPGFL